jgi:uncharacterized protein YbbC (DUF1343 family)
MVTTGLQRLVDNQVRLPEGARVGLVTNQSAVTRDRIHILHALRSLGVRVTALFAPEHGILGGQADGERVESGTDTSGIPIFSLYGGSVEKPSVEMLAGVDIVVFDVQDVGCRYYTFVNTMSRMMEACAEFGKPFYVLDRPNPINGISIEGNLLEPGFASSVGLHPIPIRHGMTVGELARMFSGEFGVGDEPNVIACEGWRREMWFDETGLPWVAPSPNMRTPDTALVYPGTCLIEGTNVSEGRGTDQPFEVIGAPWIDGELLSAAMNGIGLPGVRFVAVKFIPSASKFAGLECSGVWIQVEDRGAFQPVLTGVHLVRSLHDSYPNDFLFRPAGEDGIPFFDKLVGSDDLRLTILHKAPIDELIDKWYNQHKDFKCMRNKYLLY